MITSIVIYIWCKVPAQDRGLTTAILAIIMLCSISVGAVTDIGIARHFWR